jgi:hypothetical protein
MVCVINKQKQVNFNLYTSSLIAYPLSPGRPGIPSRPGRPDSPFGPALA